MKKAWACILAFILAFSLFPMAHGENIHSAFAVDPHFSSQPDYSVEEWISSEYNRDLLCALMMVDIQNEFCVDIVNLPYDYDTHFDVYHTFYGIEAFNGLEPLYVFDVQNEVCLGSANDCILICYYNTQKNQVLFVVFTPEYQDAACVIMNGNWFNAAYLIQNECNTFYSAIPSEVARMYDVYDMILDMM